MRKTINIKETVEYFNKLLLLSDFKAKDRTEGKQFRMGLISAVEHILHTTGNYKGYRYVDKKEAIKPYAFGCDYSKISKDPDSTELSLAGGDESRRQYVIQL
jgi:hypothetical protein